MFQTLLAFGMFWVISSVQFGGLIDAEDGSGMQQFLGLIVTLVLYMGVYFGVRAVSGGLPLFLLEFGLPIAVPMIALPWLARPAFRVVGVRIVPAKFGDAHH
ncbi:MAG: hypothetical protein R3344_11400 [Acidobacteriota bacterium]|nr:hypothetical protein [Acidobacteriota bacterium]